AAWVEDGNPIRSTTLVDLKQFIECVRAEDVVIDVRSPVETAAGVIEGSIEIYVPDIVGAELTPGTVPVLACGSGFRAMIAASLLERRDIPSRVMIGNGVPEAIRALSA
ncbi:MAG: rhodanese-like domain-containing protein, partial [Acidimicrobiia bacterium]|nr:rhodanese-like domain-containing protein [Acidimicrobiia bacterium]